MMDAENSICLAMSIDPTKYLGTWEAFNKSFLLGLRRTVQVLIFLVTVVPALVHM